MEVVELVGGSDDVDGSKAAEKGALQRQWNYETSWWSAKIGDNEHVGPHDSTNSDGA